MNIAVLGVLCKCEILVISMLVFGCANVQKRADVSLVESKGYGSTCEIAIQNAKQNAVELVTGTLLQGRRRLIGNEYLESISEFSGGTLKKFDVKSIDSGDICQVEIDALVEIGNLQLDEPKPVQFIDLKQIKEKNSKREEGLNILYQLICRPELIKLGINNVRWVSDETGSTKFNFNLIELSPSERWYSELEDFFRVQGSYVEYRRYNGNSSIIMNIFSAKENQHINRSVESAAQDTEICFASDDYSKLRCYKSTLTVQAMKYLDSFFLNQLVFDTSGRVLERLETKPFELSLYARRGFPERYSSVQGVSHVFNIVEPSDLPINVTGSLNKIIYPKMSRYEVYLGCK